METVRGDAAANSGPAKEPAARGGKLNPPAPPLSCLSVSRRGICSVRFRGTC